MPRSVVRGLPVHFQQSGVGPDVVMVHGLGANLAFWYLTVVPLLARRYRVTVYDLRGHGLTGRAPSGYTTGDLAADLLGLLDLLGIERAHLVGHSYGGAVALHAAALHPGRIASSVAADAYLPSLEHARGPVARGRARVAARRLRRGGVPLPDDLPRVAYGLVEDLARRPLPAAGGVPGPLAWSDPRAVGSRWTQLRAHSSVVPDLYDRSLSVERLAACRVPVLAVYGERSPCRPSLRGLRRARPDCEVVLVPGLGHLHPVLEPEPFARTVGDFVDRWTAASPAGRVTST